MSEVRKYIEALLRSKGFALDETRTALLEKFVAAEDILGAAAQILEIQKMITDKWRILERVHTIERQHVSVPNGTVGKPYSARLDFIKLEWNDIVFSQIEGLEDTGLSFSGSDETISGIPALSGDLKIRLRYRLEGEAEDSGLHEKSIPLIINPDPKSLWKNKESDKNDPFWKEDSLAVAAPLGDRHLVAASKRGRSHANAGSFRDDEVAFRHFENGWSVVAVADGAGSAPYSRKGSSVACAAVINYFSTVLTEPVLTEFNGILSQLGGGPETEEAQKKLSRFVYEHLSKAAWSAHQEINELAKEKGASPKDFYTTLIFVLFKKFESGYGFLSFGVGDCPIALLNREGTEVTLMNWLDVGEFGGGTRFINMPEIFSSDKFPTRFKFKLVDDFSYLMLMTDGIYDPKFAVEANLSRIESWQAFLEDLKGGNEEGASVSFDPANADIAQQLSSWMDFWSPGNHDDRTLAIVY